MQSKIYTYRDIGPAVLLVLVGVFAVIFTHQTRTISVVPLILGLALRLWAGGYLGEIANSRYIQTIRLVKEGPYRFYRHPIYMGNVFIATAFSCMHKYNEWRLLILQSCLVVGYISFTWFLIKNEEAVLQKEFGDAYKGLMKKNYKLTCNDGKEEKSELENRHKWNFNIAIKNQTWHTGKIICAFILCAWI